VSSGGVWRAAALGAFVTTAASACGSPEGGRGVEGEPSAAVVARMKGSVVTAEDLRGGGPRSSAADPARVLEAVVARRLAAEEARRRGLADRADVAEKLAAIEREAKGREEALLRDALLATLRDELAPSEEALREHYEANRIRYAERQLRVVRYPFSSREAAEEALTVASIEAESAEHLGPAPLAKLPRTVLPEAARLDRPGARSVAGSDEEGWSVVELAEVLPAEPRPFEEVREEVERSLRTAEADKAFRYLLAELRAKAKVEIDEAALGRVTPAEKGPQTSLR
jgi:parvulin-like peptidyl-prolyl cis-trans isomerase-like protein